MVILDILKLIIHVLFLRNVSTSFSKSIHSAI